MKDALILGLITFGLGLTAQALPLTPSESAGKGLYHELNQRAAS